ncbi:MAG: helix-turn-helix domain-containing protein [Candidatus Shapirobacteria bacterium]
MNNLVSELEAFGLTTQESQVYLNLLQSPSQTALSLSRSLPINRTTLYRLLEHLSRLGLVEEILDHKTTRYSASPPEKLKLVLQNKQIELNTLHQSLTSLLPNLQQLESSSPSDGWKL